MLGHLAPAAISRFVDRVYPVPLAVRDWRRGDPRDENTPAEERYVQAVLEICERERLDTVFPSWDPEVYLVSKNRARFADRGIAVPVPEWSVLRRTMDKHALMQFAADLGFPHPRTYLPCTRDEVGELASRLGFPLLVKPRFSAGGSGIDLVRHRSELERSIARVEPTYGMPMLQEWIPGGPEQRRKVAVTLDRQGHPVAVSIRRDKRMVYRSYTSQPTAAVSCVDPPLVADVVRLLQTLRYTGHARVQLMVDTRDGVAKLLEINCRPGYRVWCEIAAGQDIPLLCVLVERGLPLDPRPSGAGRDVFLNPVEDALGFLVALMERVWERIWPGAGDGTADVRPSLRELYREYRADYRAPRRFLDQYFRALADDPLAALTWYASHLAYVLRAPKRPVRSGGAHAALAQRRDADSAVPRGARTPPGA
jgi:carbamoyl-phosphate synthase large subunit